MWQHSPVHSSIGTPSGCVMRCPRTACTYVVSGSLSLPSPGCFSPFPRGTLPLSVVAGTAPWRVVPPASSGLPRAPPYLRATSPPRISFRYGPLTRSGGAFQSPSLHQCPLWRHPCGSAHVVAQPHQRVGRSPHARQWFRQVPVRSPLLGESFFFLRVLRCFSSPGSLRLPYRFREG
jgi:hypothetical protein